MSSSAAMSATAESAPETFPISNGWQARRDVGKRLRALEWKQAFLKNLDGEHLLLHCQYDSEKSQGHAMVMPSQEDPSKFQFRQPAEKEPSRTSLYHILAVDPNFHHDTSLMVHCHCLASDFWCDTKVISLEVTPNNGGDFFSFVDGEEMMLYISLKYKTEHLEKLLKG